MGVAATVETVIDADRKTVAGSAAESQGWSLQRLKAALKTDVDKPKSDVEAPKAEQIKPLPYFSLYRGATPLDVLLVVLGTIGAIGAGATLPGFTILFGNLINSFNPTDGSAVNGSAINIGTAVNKICLEFVYVGTATMLASYLEVAAWMLTGTRISNRLRRRYLRSALRQDVAFYDTEATTGILLQGLNEDTNGVQNATGEKVGQFIHHMSTFLGGIAIAFWKGWKLTLVMLSVLPLLAASGMAFGALLGKLSSKSSDAYGRANSIVQQSLSNIRTVMAFNGQDVTKDKYHSALALPQTFAIRQGVVSGLTMGTIYGVMYMTYALALWYGSTRIIAGEITGGGVLTVLFSVLMGGMSLGQAAPLLQHFITGKTAGARVWKVINRPPQIADAEGAAPLPELKGAIQLTDVHFHYPARPDVQIFSGLNLSVAAGQTVALVGESGSGKSTVVSMVSRFYDATHGQVTLDGVDIRQLPLGWLRRQIGLVSQEPCLFQTSIYDNIVYGCPGATRDQVYAAARAANAHQFISNLPNGYDTNAGETGAQVSGGQKQRIALARAILKDPRILLLDEATSALDSTSERVVQKTLEKLMPGRTTLVVAHRLSTVKAFHIAVMKQGKVVETGSHQELLAKPGGTYATLVKLQQQRHEGEEEVTDAEELEEIRGGSRRSLGIDSLHSLDTPKATSAKMLEVDAVAEAPASKKSLRQRLPWYKPTEEERLAREAEKAAKVDVSFKRLMRMNKPELPWALLGCLASAVLGAQMPTFAIALSSVIAVYYEPFGEMEGDAAMWAGVFVAIGVGSFAASIVQSSCFGLMGAKLARRVRERTFGALLRQEAAWFDEDDHSSGAMSARLATDASAVRGAVGDQLGLLVQNAVTMVGGFAIAFAYGWKMTLVVLAVVPLMMVAGWAQAVFMVGFSSDADKLFAGANQTASEAFNSIRTVSAFQMEDSISELYNKKLGPPTKASEKRAQVAGLGFGISQGILFLTYALAFWYGGREVDNGGMSFEDVLKVFFAIMLMALGISQSQMAFPDVSKAKSAIQNVFTLIDSRPKSIDVEGPGEEPKQVTGRIELREVSFTYPRRAVPIFAGFSLAVEASTTVALVGPSGSGKSTVVALVQRLYDVTGGAVLLDGVDVRQLQVRWLRSHISVVSQEPVLFSASIEENIRFGAPDATIAEVRAAAKFANAGFVESLPEGFSTQVGQSGIQLSGGQKQRIAIARAIVKNPKILLLDEATSALDAESEATVQVALEAAAKDRTTVIVAHRLSTIKTADTIAVVQDGQILEQGTHQELISLPGSGYATLVRHQQQA